MNFKRIEERRKFVSKPCALFWDESFLWGLMAWQALKEADLPFDLIDAEDVRQGILPSYRFVFVPGGWAAHKLAALGPGGKEEIRRFVEAGGGYFGICGGAGLATADGLALLSVARKPQGKRVPSFSGPIYLNLFPHQIWKDVSDTCFSVWWPSQFDLKNEGIGVRARYGRAGCGAASSDIPVEDGEVIGWPELEKRYGINLNPKRIRDEPAVVEGSFGKGRVILSLVHFDTPASPNGTQVLRNIWDYLNDESEDYQALIEPPEERPLPFYPGESDLELVSEMETMAGGLIDTGINNFLWNWRSPLLLKWRRGVRGLEYNTLFVMIAELGRRLRAIRKAGRGNLQGGEETKENLRFHREILGLRDDLPAFVALARELLLKERFSLPAGHLSPLDCDDDWIRERRIRLFGGAMSYGGHFRSIITRVDRLLFGLLRAGGAD